MKSKSSYCVVLLWLARLCANAQGFVYDQQTASSSVYVGGAAGLQQGSPIGQSFTPTLAGIDFVQFVLFDVNNGNGLGATVYVNLRSDGITGPILGTSNPFSMPDRYGQSSVNGAPPVGVFYFAATIDLQPGTVYYLEPVVQSGDQWGIRGSEFGYAGGTGYYQGLPFPTRGDLWFREGTFTVPEPSALAVFLLGAGVLAWIRRTRRSYDAFTVSSSQPQP